MCSSESTQLEILKKVLDLVVTTDRDLEPWICDTICDNIRHILKSGCTNDAFHAIRPSLTGVVLHKEFFNVKLQLQVTRLVLLHFGQGSTNPTLVLPHLDAFPAEVFEIFSLLMPFLCSESISDAKGLTTVDSEPITSGQSNGGLVTCNQGVGPRTDGAHMFKIILKKVKESSRSHCVSQRKAALSFMATYCLFRFKIKPNEVTLKLQDGFDDDFLCDVLKTIFEDDADLDGRKIAVELVEECFHHLISPDHKGFKHLSKIRARIMALGSLRSNLPVEENSYRCKELYNQIFFRELCESLLTSGKYLATQEILEKLGNAKNLVILSILSSHISERDICKAAKSCWEEMYLIRYVADRLLQQTMDVIYDDCTNMREQRSALSILNDLLDKGDLIDVINNSYVCHHFSKCDKTDFVCFMSTYLTFLMECSVDTFSMLTELGSKLFNLPDFAKSCDSLIPDLTRLLIRKLMSSDSRTRDLVLEFIGKLEQSLIDPSIVNFVLSASYKDEDFYIKSSCFKVLSGFESKMLPKDLCLKLNKIIINIEHEDSMVTIAFFLFLQKHYNLVHGHIRNCLHVISNENQCQRKDHLKNGAHQNLNLDVDSIINEVCDSADCADVSLIAAYQERETEHSTYPPEEQLVAGIFRLLSSDRCDVERMKASLELIITIMRNLSESEECLVIDFMKRGYFDLVESFNSPFLKQTIREFNSVLCGVRTFSELEKPRNQNLLTVLSLLESTPDPDIHMDCY